MEKDKTPAINKEFNTHEARKVSGFSRFIGYIKKHPLSFTITLALIIIFGTYGFMSLKIERINHKHNKRIIEISDSLRVEHLKYNVRVFSWAVRSELIRGNLEQVEQFFIEYLKIEDIVKVQLINPENNTISTSTDRKDNGELVYDKQIINAESIVIISNDDSYLLVNPIMGLDRKLGILLVEVKK